MPGGANQNQSYDNSSTYQPPANQRYIPQQNKSTPNNQNSSNYTSNFKSQDLFKQRNKSKIKQTCILYKEIKYISPSAKLAQEKKLQKSLEQNFKADKFENFQVSGNQGSHRTSGGFETETRSNSNRPQFDTSLLFIIVYKNIIEYQLFRKPNLNQTFNPWQNKGRGGYGAGNRSFSSNASNRFSGGRGPSLIFIQLVGENTIGLLFQNFFDPEIKEKIKQMKDSRFDGESAMWLFRKDRMNEIIQNIGEMCIEKGVQLVDIPEFVYNFVKCKVPFADLKGKANGKVIKLDYIQEAKQKKEIESLLPQSFYENLYDFQKKGVEFGVQNFGRLLLGDEMGVGKTIQAIGIAYVYKQDWPMLIVAPSSLRFIWRDEILKWIPSIKEKQIQTFKTGKDKWNEDACVFIMTYDLARTRSEEIEQRQFKVCIADEAHQI